MIYLETGSTDPCRNLAFEEWVLTHLADRDYLILWQNDNTVVIGQNQNAVEEINAAFVREHGIRVVRRTTGGGAVYHDLGNLNFSFITDYDRETGADMSRFTRIVTEALRRLGAEAEASGRNDILIAGKKVSGTAQRVVTVHEAAGSSRERILYHGTLLFRSDPEMIAGALHADPSKFTSKATKSVRSRVGNIADFLPREMSIEEFWQALRDTFTEEEKQELPRTDEKAAEQELPRTDEKAVEQELPRIDEKAVEELQHTKYESWDWTYGKSPEFTWKNRKRFAGGSLEADLRIEKGRIADAALYGDFLSLKPASAAAEALRGCLWTSGEVEKVLKNYPAPEYFGGIEETEVLSVILGV